jgi:hypothetical protein
VQGGRDEHNQAVGREDKIHSEEGPDPLANGVACGAPGSSLSVAGAAPRTVDGALRGAAVREPHFESTSRNLQDKNPVQVVWEAVVAVLAQTFKNHPNDHFGTQIPFSGTFANPQVDVWTTIVNVLRNTFIKAIQPGLDATITPQKVRQDTRQQSGK